MNTKHTPGPWVADTGYISEVRGRQLAVIKKHATRNQTICLVTPTSTMSIEDDTNARLIAAAPELLEALQLMYDLAYSGQSAGNDDLDKAFSTIKKATNE